MRKLLLFLLLASFIFIKSPKASNITNYCYYPPFLGQVAVSPNVMLLIDASGSMSWCAYNPRSNMSGCCSSSSGCGWTYRGTEEGYFDPTKVYIYNSSQGYWEETTGTPATCPKRKNDINLNNRYSGGCLNFLYMTRIDLVRWALTGGTPDSCTTSINQSPQNNIVKCNPETYGQSGSQVSCDSYGCILKSSLGVRVRVPWSRINSALLFQLKNLSLKPRIGVMFFSGSGIRNNASVYIGDFTASNNYDALNPYKNTITAINQEDPSGTTPTAPALWDTYNYFAQQNSQYGGLIPQQSGGDQWRNPIYQCFDENNDGQCQSSEFKLVPCAKNFVILLTDGQWNYGGGPPATLACSIDDGFERPSADPVVPAYWLHKRGFTNSKTGINSKVEAIYGIGLWLGGTGELSLKNVSMYGSFDTTGRNWPSNLTGYPQNTCWMDDCSNYTGSNGKGSGCTPLPPSSPDWDKSGDGIPDTFYSASNATEIKNSLLSAILDILRRASSGASVATLISRASSSSVVVQPFSYPEYVDADGRKVSWIGFLRSLWIDPSQNIREDSVLDKILQLIGNYRDKIIQFFFDPNSQETKVVLRDPEAGTCPASYAGTKRLEEINYLLMHDCALANLQSQSDRRIYYRRGGNVREFSTSNWNDLLNVWNQVDSNINTQAEAERIINYLRGEYDYTYLSNTDADQYTARKRQFNSSAICPGYNTGGAATPWKLGFINASTPSVAGNVPLLDNWIYTYQDASYRSYVGSNDYKNRRFVSIVGAYDGMLHFFRIGKLTNTGDTWAPVRLDNHDFGKEEYAIIPENALPYMLWYGKADYCPVPIIDYRSQVVDLPLSGGSNGVLSQNSWRTYLIGVMGLGGKGLQGRNFSSSVFMLDLTDYLKNPNTPPQFFFETRLDDYELTTSFPVVVRQLTNISSPEKNGKFYLILGSGPLDPYADSPDKFTNSPKLYTIELSDTTNPSISKRIDLNNLSGLPGTQRNFAVSDLVALDLDQDKRDDVIYFGVYGFYQQGNDWNWFGGLYRIALKVNGNYRDVSQITDSDIKPVIVLADNNFRGPVFGRPSASLDDSGNLWTYFATGIFTSPNHRSSPWGDNYIFGIKDPCWDPTNKSFNSSCNQVSRTQLKDQTNVDLQYSSIVEQETICTCGPSGCSEQTVVKSVMPTNFNQILNQMSSYRGWYVNIGRRLSYSAVQIFGGYAYVMATEFPQTQDICQQTPKTRLYALYYKTGTAGPNVGILIPGMTSGGIVSKSVDLGFGAAPFGPVLQVASSSSGELLAVFQTSVGAVQQVRLQSAHGGLRRILWIEK